MSDNKNVNLTIDSRIISHLGEALIDDEKVALLELVKNSSDADALNCSIVIDTYFESEYGEGKIIIEDNGNGMNPHIIENAFLKIATSFKKKHQKISPKFKRLAQGNKGIGRLALNQLGKHISVQTKLDLSIVPSNLTEDILTSTYGVETLDDLILQENDTYSSFAIDWNMYEESDTKVEDIPIEIERKIFNSEVFNHKKKHGTRIEVSGLKGLDFWRNAETANELESEVLAFLNPYEDEDVNFRVSIKLDNKTFRNDTYDKEYIKKSCDSYFSFKFDEKEMELELKTVRSKEYIQRQIKEMVDNLENRKLKLLDNSIDTINYEEYYDKYLVETKTIDMKTKKSIYRDSPKSDLKEAFTYSGYEELESLYLPGSFFGEIYGYDFSAHAITSELKKLVQSIIGVKLYRNSFRMFPYGSDGNDWLGMSSFNSRTKSVIYKLHTTTGFINVNGENNLELLQELTNRQGLRLDKYGKNFLLMMKELIYKNAAYQDLDFTNNFSFVRKEISEMLIGETIVIAGLTFKRIKDGIDELRDTVKELEEIIENEETINNKEVLKKTVNKISEGSGNVGVEFATKERQIKEDYRYFNELLPVIGATIISETLAHEIIRLSNNVNTYSSKIRKAIPENDTKTMTRNLGSIDSDIKFLARYASLLDVNSYSKRRKFEEASVKETIENIVIESPLLVYKNLKLDYSILGNDFSIKLVKDSFKIIIENFIINSTYWLDRMEIESPVIIFELNNHLKQLIIYDNGLGIDNNVVNKLFDPFVTNKPSGDGRGMGLNIVKEMLKEIGASIVLSTELNEYNKQYKFIITFSEEDNE